MLKKFLFIFVLTFVMAVPVFADGDLPTGNRCQPPATCFVDPSGDNKPETATQNKPAESDIFTIIKSWLRELLG